jgi:hypothetical protein
MSSARGQSIWAAAHQRRNQVFFGFSFLFLIFPGWFFDLFTDSSRFLRFWLSGFPELQNCKFEKKLI